jgi:hypothetical protein
MSSYSASNPVIIHAGESMTHLLKELSIESLGDFKEFCRRFVALKVQQGWANPLRAINYRTLLTEKVRHQVDWQLASEGLSFPNVYEDSGWGSKDNGLVEVELCRSGPSFEQEVGKHELRCK